MTDQQLYDKAAAEFRNNTMDTGLWARAMSEVDGDEAQAREVYIALRAERLAEDPSAADEADPAAAAGQSSGPGGGGGGGRLLAYGAVCVAALVIAIALIALAQ